MNDTEVKIFGKSPYTVHNRVVGDIGKGYKKAEKLLIKTDVNVDATYEKGGHMVSLFQRNEVMYMAETYAHDSEGKVHCLWTVSDPLFKENQGRNSQIRKLHKSLTGWIKTHYLAPALPEDAEKELTEIDK